LILIDDLGYAFCYANLAVLWLNGKA